MDKNVRFFLEKLKKRKDFGRVKFIILFGSQARGNPNKFSDYDFAVYYDANSDERYEFRKDFGGDFSDKFDVLVFQDLPLYIQKEVIKGKIIYVVDEGFLYDVAYKTIKRFEDFKKYYYDYINRRPVLSW